MHQQIEAENAELEKAKISSNKAKEGAGGDYTDEDRRIEHIQLGSRSNLLTLGLLEDLNRGDLAFQRLDARVRAFISSIDPLFQSSAHCPIKVFYLFIYC